MAQQQQNNGTINMLTGGLWRDGIDMLKKENSYKICISCGELKEIDDFYKAKKYKSGVDNKCKDCSRTTALDWYRKNDSPNRSRPNREKIVDGKLVCNTCGNNREISWYIKTKTGHIGAKCRLCRQAKQKEVRNKKPLKYREYTKKYNKSDKGKIAIAKSNEKSRKEYPHIYKMRDSLWKFIRYSGRQKRESTVTELGYSVDAFRNKFPELHKGYDIDHKIPINWFLSETPVSVVNALDNLQLIKSSINRSKQHRYSSPVSQDFYITVKDWVKEELIDKVIIV